MREASIEEEGHPRLFFQDLSIIVRGKHATLQLTRTEVHTGHTGRQAAVIRHAPGRVPGEVEHCHVVCGQCPLSPWLIAVIVAVAVGIPCGGAGLPGALLGKR